MDFIVNNNNYNNNNYFSNNDNYSVNNNNNNNNNNNGNTITTNSSISNSYNNNVNNKKIEIRDSNFKEDDETDESKPWSYFFEDYPYPNKHLTRIMLLKNKVEHYIKNKIKIPDDYRTKIWALMEDLDKFKNNEKHKDIYQKCLDTPNEEIENDVRTDAVRTFPSSQYKVKMRDKQLQNSKDSLYRVLKAYAIYNEEVQYTQGMNYLCLVLLCYFYEEESFWMMDLLIKKHGMRHFFKKKSFLPSYLTIFELELENHLPDLSKHLKNEGIQMYMFIQGWWSTIFVYILPVETISTIWDYFFWGANGNGHSIEVLFRLSIALLKMLETHLLEVRMTEFFDTLKEHSSKIDTLELVYQAYSIHLSVKTDHFLREEILKYQEDEMNDNIFDFQKLLTTTYQNDKTTSDGDSSSIYDLNNSSNNIKNIKNNNNNNGSNNNFNNSNGKRNHHDYDDDDDEEEGDYIDYDNYYRNSVIISDSDDEDNGNQNFQNRSACIIN